MIEEAGIKRVDIVRVATFLDKILRHFGFLSPFRGLWTQCRGFGGYFWRTVGSMDRDHEAEEKRGQAA